MSDGVEILTDSERLTEIAGQWRALAVSRANAFVTPDWFSAWMSVYGGDATPLVVVRRDGSGELAGVMPLVAAGWGRSRTLRFAGAALGDLFLPLDRDSESELAVAALRALRAGGEDGALILDHVEADSAWVQALAQQGEVVTHLSHLDEVLPEVEIAGLSWEQYLGERSRNFRSQLGRRRRQLERDHDVVFRRSDAARLAADMSAFARLHRDRWAGRGGSGALDQTSTAFHSLFSAALLEQDWLRLWIVEVDGEPAAAWYGWRIGDRYSYYLAGFDETYADYSIGTLLLAHTIEDAIASGCSVYEMLLGSEPFKRRFATGERQVTSVILSSRLHRARLAALGAAAARRATDRLGPSARARIKRPLRALADRLSPRGTR
ncbi:MAG: hypothetical protein QOI10_1516 [Solirubrobacterales bacterium]|jgi:CelD/BcsL family acetyltransferase involved in cellulose biosynthesis|nr:hypothetical protein [Solirubrobacterales bacterium]